MYLFWNSNSRKRRKKSTYLNNSAEKRKKRSTYLNNPAGKRKRRSTYLNNIVENKKCKSEDSGKGNRKQDFYVPKDGENKNNLR